MKICGNCEESSGFDHYVFESSDSTLDPSAAEPKLHRCSDCGIGHTESEYQELKDL